MSEWQKIQLGSVVKNISETYKFTDSQVIFLNTSDIYNNKILHSTYSSPDILPGQAKKRIKNGDLLFSEIRPVNKRFSIVNVYNPEHYVVSTKLMVLRCTPKIDVEYLRFLLTSQEQLEYLQMIAEDRSGTFPQITFEHISSIWVELPFFDEQKAIASVLFSLDNKIDLLHRQNKTLESMAETLFRQWFVEGSNDSYKEVELHEIIEFNPKRVLPKGSKAMYLEMAGLNTNTFAASGYYERDFTSGQKFIKQDTLLARITPCLENGKAGYVHFLSPEQVGWGSTEFIVLRPKPKFHPLFSYILCRNNEFKEYAESCMEGSSGRQRVNVSHLSMYTLTLPHDDVITQFNEILASIEPKLISNALQIQTLEKLRDTLLPKLMSGEVRVSYTPEEIKQ